MTLEEVQQLLVQIVSELKPNSHFPEGVLSADVGWQLAKAGHKGLARQFGYSKLSAFIEALCVGPLVVRRDVLGAQDVLIDLADSSPAAAPSSGLATGSSARSSGQQRITGFVSVKPQIWNAVLKGEREIYINDQGHTATVPGEDGKNWKPLGMLPIEEQQRLLERAEQFACDISSEPVRDAVLHEIKRVQRASQPLTEFGNVTAGIHQFSKAWHTARIAAVVDFAKASTGLTEEKIMVSTSYTPKTQAQGETTPRSSPARGTTAMRSTPAGHQASRPMDEDLRRRLLKQVIDVMPLKDLLELRIPMSADSLALLDRQYSR